MRQPYKVVVWGPGAVGKACLRELIKRPEFEIVGVLAYSPSKVGRDVGELIDHSPIGVKVTNDKEAIFAIKADCVLYSGIIQVDSVTMENDLIRLLESGKNVVSAVSHHYPLFHNKAYSDRLAAACQKGKTSIYGAGENPGFWFERVALTMTGVCSEVEHLKLEEYVDIAPGGTSADLLYAIGFNQTVEKASEPGPLTEVWKSYYFVESLALASQTLFNRQPDRIERNSTFHIAGKPIVLSKAKGDPIDLFIEQGKVGATTHSFSAYFDGQPKLTTEVTWYLDRENAPFPVKDDHYWRLRIEGKPVSLDCEFSAFASLKGNQLTHPGDPTAMTWYIAASVMIQAIPVVCAHKPGVVLPSIFTHTVPDYRLLEDRTSVVG